MTEIGYHWLASTYQCPPVQPFTVVSAIGRTRSTTITDQIRREVYVESYRPEPTPAGHLAFALRYEGIHPEFLSRLFRQDGWQHILAEWISREPTGAYARRACFFYEWLTGLRLAVADIGQGNYVDALNPDEYLVGQAVNVARWRVRDNLPGNRDFCPVVRRTEQVKAAEQLAIGRHIRQLEQDFGIDLLLRSAVWLTIKESRASFQIEHEQNQEDRIRRFAAVMESECGQHADPLAPSTLEVLQRGILGQNALRYGLRRSPVYVGHTVRYQPVVDYIGPHWNHTPALLAGLANHLERTAGQSAVIRAATASFGFVYIHPMADGNGRISRFLINDILRRDNAVPAPLIVPVSATITHSTRNRADYDRVLERFSKPLMQRYADQYAFGETVIAEDGVPYNFHFRHYDDALPAWRYPDLTTQVVYLAQVIEETLTQEMRAEADFLRVHDQARAAMKAVLEAPDHDLDVMIRSIRENGGKLSNKLCKQYPLLSERPELGERLVAVVMEAFGGETQ